MAARLVWLHLEVVSRDAPAAVMTLVNAQFLNAIDAKRQRRLMVTKQVANAAILIVTL